MATNGDPERVLVTGASGYLGSHIVQLAQKAGYKVRGSVRDPEDEKKVKHLKTLCPEAAHEVELVKAELQDADSWKSAVESCTYVIHTASPFPFAAPRNPDDVIKPAVEGVTNLLKACVEAKTVKRVVLTSAGLAICGTLRGVEVSEKDWPETDKLDAYAKSKTLAEKAAWDFVKELKDEEKFELVVLNPVSMLGPVISTTMCTSIELIKRLLERNPMFLPKMNLPMVDVRDAAAAHIKALTIPEAAGNRHILCTQNMWWSEVAAILSAEFKSQGYNVPSMGVPKAAVSMASVFKKDAKQVLPIWNKTTKFDNTRMKEVLQMTEPRDMKIAIIEMAYSIIEGGFVKRSKKYRGEHGKEEGAANGPTKNGEIKEDSKPKEDGEVVTTGDKEEGKGKEGEAIAEGEAKTGDDSKKEADGDASEEKKEAPAAAVSEKEEGDPASATEGENKTDEAKEVESKASTEPAKEDKAEEADNKEDTPEESGDKEAAAESKKDEVEVNGEVDASGDAAAAE
ncbi:anthocyanidin reductase ((2S)-flavan-3-ol-forming)-like [Acanthaster planci]|uniref:Anthocyanidin reductase ((2S)-flavan-3-ol-forming)-like n=1 Tax=Acanthaster planci TaxID=133434 RepID=A0A8B7ZAM7_ACAPL|nr:anthocyanidin reductase ((2S)-flavan-3-ol-forming)-like [Acanthaster planci]